MGAAVVPFAQVSREAREKEAGGGGFTPEASHVQHSAAQRSFGKVVSVHNRVDLRASPARTARGHIAFILPFSFGFALLVRSAESGYVSGWPLAMGCNPTVDDRGGALRQWIRGRRIGKAEMPDFLPSAQRQTGAEAGG
jgi:hypothetical protein